MRQRLDEGLRECFEIECDLVLDRARIGRDPHVEIVELALARIELLADRVDPGLQLLEIEPVRAHPDAEVRFEIRARASGVGRGVVEDDLRAIASEEPLEVRHQLRHPTRGILGLRPILGGQREQDGLCRDAGEPLLDVLDNGGALVGVQQVHLAEHEDQAILGRLEDAAAQKLALAILERLPCIEQEHDGIGARHVAVRDLRALLVEIVDARGIDQHDVVDQQVARVAELDIRDFTRVATGDGDPFFERGRIEELALTRGQDDARRGVRRVHHVIDRCGRRCDAGRQDIETEQRVHERRLAVVELAEHDEVEPLRLELGNPGGADIAGERHHADLIGDVGELREASDDLALGLLVMFEQDHQNTLIKLATCLSTSGRLALPVTSWPVSWA